MPHIIPKDDSTNARSMLTHYRIPGRIRRPRPPTEGRMGNARPTRCAPATARSTRLAVTTALHCQVAAFQPFLPAVSAPTRRKSIPWKHNILLDPFTLRGLGRPRPVVLSVPVLMALAARANGASGDHRPPGTRLGAVRFGRAAALELARCSAPESRLLFSRVVL